MSEDSKIQVQANYVIDALNAALNETRQQHLMLTALVNQQDAELASLRARIIELEEANVKANDDSN